MPIPSWESIVGTGGSLAILFSFYTLGQSQAESAKERELAGLNSGVITRAPATAIGLLGAEPKATVAPTPTLASNEALSDPRDLELLALSQDPAVVVEGGSQYAMFCVACHAAADIGGESPSNLFDTVWYHGAKPSEIEQTILNGYLDAGMPPWQGMIPDDQIAAMVAYLIADKE